ncbi:MAG: LrgB family protein [Burkholderiales bacterium]
MTPKFFEIWVYLSASPLLWLTVTLLAYQAAYLIYRASGMNPLANPVLISVSFIVCVLLASGTPYETYFDGAQFVHFLIGPSTVALAIPLYAQLERLKAMFVPVMIATLVGSITAIGSAVAIGWALGASTETLLSLAPKSATLPIAMGVAEKIGGLPSLTAVTVAITGISGAIMVRALLNLIGVKDYAVRGFAVGITAHGIGTARALQVSETAGAFSALAMALNGVATTLLLTFAIKLMGN